MQSAQESELTFDAILSTVSESLLLPRLSDNDTGCHANLYFYHPNFSLIFLISGRLGEVADTKQCRASGTTTVEIRWYGTVGAIRKALSCLNMLFFACVRVWSWAVLIFFR